MEPPKPPVAEEQGQAGDAAAAPEVDLPRMEAASGTELADNEREIERILQPNSTYLNLNPFYVLQLSEECTIEEVKRQFRRLSLLVHPDRNPNNPRAKQAFEEINKAQKALHEEKDLEFYKGVVEEARTRVDEEIKAQKKEFKKKHGNDAAFEVDPAQVRSRACQLSATHIRSKRGNYALDYWLYTNLFQGHSVTRKRWMVAHPSGFWCLCDCRKRPWCKRRRVASL